MKLASHVAAAGPITIRSDMIMMLRVVLRYIACGTLVSVVRSIQPLHVWPLGNTSLHYDVIGDSDIAYDEDKQCFAFDDGPVGLPYSVFDLGDGATSYLDVNLKGKNLLKDVTISFYVKPTGSDVSGTLLHYQHDDREIMRIRCLANTFLVSFRDEYGMSAGMMYLPNFLSSGEWNHVIVSRDYETGRIAVHKDGVEMYNEDDEFSDTISFAAAATLRLGKSQDVDDEDVFSGNFACLQLYPSVVETEDIQALQDMCLPEQWTRQPAVYYKWDGDLWCLTEKLLAAPPPEPEIGDVISMTVVTMGPYWKAFMKKYELQDSQKDQGYFKISARDFLPVPDSTLMCHVNVTAGTRVCSRLCMRTKDCASFALDSNDLSDALEQCMLYSAVSTELEPVEGAKYYKVVR